MTETIGIKLNTISEAVRDIMCEAHNEALDNFMKKVYEREALIDRLLKNGEAIIGPVYGDRWCRLFEMRQKLYMKKWELYWVEKTYCEMRFM